MLITSLQNPRVKELVKLKNRRRRDERQVALIEGYKAVRSALENGFTLDEMYYCPELSLGENAKLVDEAIRRGIRTYQMTLGVFSKIAYRDRPEGVIATAPQVHKSLEDLVVDEHSLFLVAEAIEKPGNLGTMLRSSDAARVSGVIVCDPRTDVYNPNVVRASIGTLFTVPIVTTDTAKFVRWKDKHGIKVLATTPSASTVYTHVDMTGKVALVVGTEQVGLSDEWLRMADERVLIPMYGQADSLNVSAATTLVLFEAVRQRRLKHLLD